MFVRFIGWKRWKVGGRVKESESIHAYMINTQGQPNKLFIWRKKIWIWICGYISIQSNSRQEKGSQIFLFGLEFKYFFSITLSIHEFSPPPFFIPKFYTTTTATHNFSFSNKIIENHQFLCVKVLCRMYVCVCSMDVFFCANALNKRTIIPFWLNNFKYNIRLKLYSVCVPFFNIIYRMSEFS